MAKVTSKLQVTIPKAIAERYDIVPGDELDWVPSDGAVRVVPLKGLARASDSVERLRLFDAATERQRQRAAALPRPEGDTGRGWTRAELYEHGKPG